MYSGYHNCRESFSCLSLPGIWTLIIAGRHIHLVPADFPNSPCLPHHTSLYSKGGYSVPKQHCKSSVKVRTHFCSQGSIFHLPHHCSPACSLKLLYFQETSAFPDKLGCLKSHCHLTIRDFDRRPDCLSTLNTIIIIIIPGDMLLGHLSARTYQFVL